jgi:hypothetical protein
MHQGVSCHENSDNGAKQKRSGIGQIPTAVRNAADSLASKLECPSREPFFGRLSNTQTYNLAQVVTPVTIASLYVVPPNDDNAHTDLNPHIPFHVQISLPIGLELQHSNDCNCCC